MLKQSYIFLLLVPLLFIASCRKDDIVEKRDYKTLGTSAKDFLADVTYTSLQIEVSHMPNYDPPQQVLDHLQNFLTTHLNKPAGITISKKQISGGGKSIYTIAEIANLERSVRSIFSKGNTLTAHVLIVDGDYDKERVLGTAYWNTSIVIFGKTWHASSGAIGQVSRVNLLTSVLEHEFGHLFGLVDQGTPMVTFHKNEGAHCNNNKCLMYHQIETGGLLTSAIPGFDANCIADLRANGGK